MPSVRSGVASGCQPTVAVIATADGIAAACRSNSASRSSSSFLQVGCPVTRNASHRNHTWHLIPRGKLSNVSQTTEYPTWHGISRGAVMPRSMLSHTATYAAPVLLRVLHCGRPDDVEMRLELCDGCDLLHSAAGKESRLSCHACSSASKIAGETRSDAWPCDRFSVSSSSSSSPLA